MHVIAGHADAKGSILLPWDTQDPPDTLQQMILPFIDGALDSIAGRSSNFPTGLPFFKMFQRLHSFILQDVACLILAGRTHSLFEHPVFQMDDFKIFTVQISTHINQAHDLINAFIDLILTTFYESIKNVMTTVKQDLMT